MEVRPLRMYLPCALLPLQIILLKNYLEKFNMLFRFRIRKHVDLVNQSSPSYFFLQQRKGMNVYVNQKNTIKVLTIKWPLFES